MNQDNQQAATLQQWWDQADFPHKALYTLTEQGDIVLNAIGDHKERTIGSVTEDNPDAMLKALLEKYPEVETKVAELQKEWEAEQGDKMTLYGKVERTKDYILHAKALGNFPELLAQLEKMELVLKTIADENYQQKLNLVQEAENLMAVEDDNWKEATQTFQNYTDKWKEIGHTDKDRNDELWMRLEKARDKFFENKREHNEEVEHEMLQNLDLKMEVVEKAEQLAASDDWKGATEAYKELMEQWKSIGRTMHDKNEELWNKFITAKNAFFDRKKEHFNEIQEEQEKNYELKLKLVEKSEEIQSSTDWKGTTKAYSDIMDEWKKIGRVPREKTDELWNRLNAAKDVFFNAKRDHFSAFKVSLEDNYAQKQALLKRAEEIQNANSWRETTDEMNELMTEWKSIGPVPRQHSNAIWERFLAARKNFFARKDADRDRRKKNAVKRVHQRVQQTHDFHRKLIHELEEEQDKLADFKDGLENITPGKKADELREHLTKLIAQTEKKIQHKEEKLKEIEDQIEEVEAKAEEQDQKKAEAAAQENHTPKAEENPTAEEVTQEAATDNNDEATEEEKKD